MKKIIEEYKKVNTEKIMSIDEVVKELINYLNDDYFNDSCYDEEPMSIDDYKDEVKDILTYSLDIENVSDEELEEIANKTYLTFIDKCNKFRNEQKDYEKSLFQDRNSIRDELSNWYDYEDDVCFLTLDEIIDLIIENGNK